METMDLLCSRKSVRSYTGEKVSQEILQAVLKAANASPIGMGKYESVHLTLIEDPSLLSEIDSSAAQFFGNPSIHPIYGAPVLILVSVKAENPGNTDYSNAAIVAHNMSLAADNLGAGTCLIWGAVAALNENPDLVQKLGLPEGYIPCCGITLGVTEVTYTLRDIPENRIALSRI